VYISPGVDVLATQSRCLRLRENDFEKQIKTELYNIQAYKLRVIFKYTTDVEGSIAETYIWKSNFSLTPENREHGTR